MTDYEKFKAALEALCIEHGYMLTTSMYDMIVARKMEKGDPPIWQDGIEEAEW